MPVSPPVYRDTWIRLIGIPLITAFGYYLTYDNIQFTGLFVYELLSDGLKVWLVWELTRGIIRRLDGRLPWNGGVLRRLLVQLPLTCCGGMAVLTLLVTLEYAFIRPYPNQHYFSFDLVIAFIFLLLVNVLYISLYYYDSYLRSVAEKEAMAEALRLAAQPPRATEHFVVRVGRREVVVPLVEVLCLYSEEKETFLLTRDHKRYVLEASLDKVEEQLPAADFFRVNRKFILTSALVASVRPEAYGKLSIQLQPHDRLPAQLTVSRDKAPAFREWLKG